MVRKERKERTKAEDVTTRFATIHIAKHTFGVTFKQRAPRALKAVRDFARKMMRTEKVTIDPAVNKYLWSKGIRAVPRRVRVRIARKVDESSSDLCTHVSLVPITNPKDFRGLKTTKAAE